MDQLRRDKQKADFCKINDLKLIEIYDTDELNPSLFKSFGILD